MNGDAVEAALVPILESLRAKLLDLSTRNRLLAFSHKTAACLRVVDELPDQIFQDLMEGKEFSFAAVPEPSQSELRAYHAADSDVPRAESSLGCPAAAEGRDLGAALRNRGAL